MRPASRLRRDSCANKFFSGFLLPDAKQQVLLVFGGLRSKRLPIFGGASKLLGLLAGQVQTEFKCQKQGKSLAFDPKTLFPRKVAR